MSGGGKRVHCDGLRLARKRVSSSWQSRQTQLLRGQQAPSQQVQIRQRKGGEQPRGVLRQTSIAHLAETPQVLNDLEGMLAARPGARAQLVDASLVLGEWPMARG